MKVGEIMPLDREIVLNEGKPSLTLTVANTGDRPVQVGSHFHFFEVNRCLSFDREKAYGFHLDIPSGTSVRFEPGEEKVVQLTAMGGTKRVFGLKRFNQRSGFRGYESGRSGEGKAERFHKIKRRNSHEHKNIRRKIRHDVRSHHRR